jgi:hypothetical protein
MVTAAEMATAAEMVTTAQVAVAGKVTAELHEEKPSKQQVISIQ